jgi:hypothetical protein
MLETIVRFGPSGTTGLHLTRLGAVILKQIHR